MTSVPFTYTVDWYRSDKRNEVYRRAGTGVYTDVMTNVLLHELVEVALPG